jgi:hypothetical protein
MPDCRGNRRLRMKPLNAVPLVCVVLSAVLLHPAAASRPQTHPQPQPRFSPAAEDAFRSDLAIAYSLNSFLEQPHRILDAPTPPESVGIVMRRYEAVINAYSQRGEPVVYVQWTVCVESSGGDIYLKEEYRLPNDSQRLSK